MTPITPSGVETRSILQAVRPLEGGEHAPDRVGQARHLVDRARDPFDPRGIEHEAIDKRSRPSGAACIRKVERVLREDDALGAADLIRHRGECAALRLGGGERQAMRGGARAPADIEHELGEGCLARPGLPVAFVGGDGGAHVSRNLRQVPRSYLPASPTPHAEGLDGGRSYIGTSGWHYESWLGPFYPARHPKPKLLAFYTGVFSATEINLSFYRLPSEAAVACWRDTTPDDFVFRLEGASGHHALPAADQSRGADRERVRQDGRPRTEGRPGALPASAALQGEPRAARLLHRSAAEGGRYVFEFREPSWYEDAILDVLRNTGCALCISDHAHAPAPWIATADFVYVRGHGPSGRYHGSYEDEALAEWARHGHAWRREGRDVFSFFDNDIKAAAPADAQRLAVLMRRSGLGLQRDSRKGEVVAVDHLRAAGVAEDRLDLAAGAAEDARRLVGIVGDQTPPDHDARRITDKHRHRRGRTRPRSP
jgi:uncharacterized protein YecE (DUF72 family)